MHDSEIRELNFAQAVHEGLESCMTRDEKVLIFGEGVTDPKAIFGTTAGLVERFGTDRIIETPVSESAVTGLAIGAAIMGYRPVLIHQRVDFALVSMDQIINNAAKWHYMYGGQNSVPMVIRMIVGRGWGQGPQHSQSLESLFGHIPGLKVAMPSNAHDAKGMMTWAIEDNNPVVLIEHRWLHHTTSHVPECHYAIDAEAPNVCRPGKDITIVATSFMVVEALKVARVLESRGIEAEIIDLAVIRPLDTGPVVESVKKTGRLIALDTGWSTFGVGGEVVARVAEQALSALTAPPVRFGAADHPSPSSPGLIGDFYPSVEKILDACAGLLDLDPKSLRGQLKTIFPERQALPIDVPDRSFTGPF